jgi:hypothetical protein
VALTGPASSTLVPCVICLDAAIYLVHLSILPTLTHPSLQYHNHPQSPARLSLSHRSPSTLPSPSPTRHALHPRQGPCLHVLHRTLVPDPLPCRATPRARFSMKPHFVRCHAHCCTFLVPQNPSHRIEIVRSHPLPSQPPQRPPANLRTHLFSLLHNTHTYTYAPHPQPASQLTKPV